MSDNIDVSDIPRGALLAELYNRASPTGLGVLQARAGDMTDEQAEALINGDEVETDYDGALRHKRGDGKPAYFDYLYGRPLKVTIDGKSLRPFAYDRDHGEGAAASAVEAVRARTIAEDRNERQGD